MGNIDNINAVQTPKGWMLRIKQGAQWLNTVLHGDIINDKNVFIPKAWYKIGTTTDSSGAHFTQKIYLPNYINKENIMGILFGIDSTGSGGGFDFWSQGSQKMASSDEADATSAGINSATKNLRVRYHSGSNYIQIESPDYSGRPTLDVHNKPFKLTIIFK